MHILELIKQSSLEVEFILSLKVENLVVPCSEATVPFLSYRFYPSIHPPIILDRVGKESVSHKTEGCCKVKQQPSTGI